jgi:CHASE2 domain-containing sensor protein
LGLAQQLSELQLPHLVVMREPIPDQVAQEFVKYFLNAFSRGKTLSLAVREARERLQGLEGDFPYASWLPVICQNPTSRSLRWQNLLGLTSHRKFARLPLIVASSIIATASVLGARNLGWLQPWELNAYDQLMRLRPAEKPDDRLLIITITDEEVRSQGGLPISSTLLAKALSQIETHQPRVIGLLPFSDKFKSNSKEKKIPSFKSKNLIGSCKLADESGSNSLDAMPGITSDRQGFAYVPMDYDAKLRRHYLSGLPQNNSLCKTEYSFELQVALAYLTQEGVSHSTINQGEHRFNNIIFTRLKPSGGVYRDIDKRGEQIMINYRATLNNSLENIAPKITLNQAISGSFSPNLVKGKVVLIGMDNSFTKSNAMTPYSPDYKPIRSIYLEAQMISQILSAVLDKRPLISIPSGFQDAIWIFLWSTIATFVVLERYSRWMVFLIRFGVVLTLGTSSFFALSFSGIWLPLIPSLLSFLLSQIIFKLTLAFDKKQLTHNILSNA